MKQNAAQFDVKFWKRSALKRGKLDAAGFVANHFFDLLGLLGPSDFLSGSKFSAYSAIKIQGFVYWRALKFSEASVYSFKWRMLR